MFGRVTKLFNNDALRRCVVALYVSTLITRACAQRLPKRECWLIADVAQDAKRGTEARVF